MNVKRISSRKVVVGGVTFTKNEVGIYLTFEFCDENHMSSLKFFLEMEDEDRCGEDAMKEILSLDLYLN